MLAVALMPPGQTGFRLRRFLFLPLAAAVAAVVALTDVRAGPAAAVAITDPGEQELPARETTVAMGMSGRMAAAAAAEVRAAPDKAAMAETVGPDTALSLSPGSLTALLAAVVAAGICLLEMELRSTVEVRAAAAPVVTRPPTGQAAAEVDARAGQMT